MMKKRGFLLVAMSLLMGVGAAWVANNWVQIRNGQIATIEDNETAVVVASMDIPYGTKIAPRHLDTIMVPPAMLPKDFECDGGLAGL